MSVASELHPNITYQQPTESQLATAEKWVRRFAEKWKKPDAESLRELMLPDTQNLVPPMTVPADREGVVEHFRQILERLPDLHLSVIRWAPFGDGAMIEWEANATVAGKPLSWRGVDRVCLRDGLSYEGQVYWDTRSLAQRMAEANGASGN